MHFSLIYKPKTLRYERLALDCQGMVYYTHKMHLYIGSRGVILASNHTALAIIFRICKIRDLKSFRSALLKISVMVSK